MRSTLLSLIASAVIVAFCPCLRASCDASASKTEAELRAKVVDGFRAMASVEWTPSEDIPYYSEDSSFCFKKGETYYGVPYSQKMRNTDLSKFEAQLKKVDGANVYVGPCGRDYLGSDCSATLCAAWRQADPNMPALLSRRMIPDRPSPIVPVGKYALDFYDSTPDIVKANGFDVMKAAYAQLKPGDGLVTHSNYDGHAMLVLKNDPENQRLYIGEQTGLCDNAPNGREGRATMRVDVEFSYQGLFDRAYIPIACKVVDDATHEIQLFNGQDLDDWSVYVAGEGNADSTGVFTVENGAIHVSGKKWGGIMTKGEYSNYRLTVEFKWGEGVYLGKVGKARDSGVLIHSFGPQDAFGVWAKSVEANLVEGGIGDFWIVGDEKDGVVGTCDASRDETDNELGRYRFDPKNGKPVTFTKNGDGCFQWFGRSADWQDVTGFRGPCDVDKPGEWNEMVIYAVGNEMDVYVNGVFVNRVYDLGQSSGAIQLQSEGAEIFFRRVSLRPWGETL